MDDLLVQSKKVLNSAEIVYKTGDYTSATILYFKALFMLLDSIILKSQGKSPKDHTERFRVLEKNFSDLYLILDKYYQVYRNTYTVSISKEICEEVHGAVKLVVEKYKIKF